jgi:hypothetical protein
MLIEFTRPGSRRVIGQYEWRAENGHVCQVDDPELLKELFTHPAYGGDFAVHADEPLAQITGSTHAAQLLVVYGGIADAVTLAGLTKEEAGRLAASLLETPRTVSGWIRAARSVIGRQEKHQAEETAVPPTASSTEVD